MDLREIVLESMDWIYLAQDRDRWRAFVNTIMNIRIPWNEEHFLASWATVIFSRMILLRGISLRLVVRTQAGDVVSSRWHRSLHSARPLGATVPQCHTVCLILSQTLCQPTASSTRATRWIRLDLPDISLILITLVNSLSVGQSSACL
jgi:hypothetical protein